MEAPQKITTTEIEERDLVAAHVEGERAAVQVWSVRDGKVVAREGFLLDRLTEPELVLATTRAAVLRLRPLRPARGAGARAAIPDAELLAAWLEARRGAAVTIRVPQRGEKLRLLELVERNARLAFELEWKHPRKQSQEILRALRDLLDLEVEPQRIECFDISNIQGSDIVASMVVFEGALPKKSDYRKFRIRSVSGAPDDFASMREVVTRRYERLLGEGKEMPDLVLIDGGPGQLGAAVGALEEIGLGDQPVASLAKREELLFVRGRDAADRAAALLARAPARAAGARRGAPLRDRLPPPGAQRAGRCTPSSTRSTASARPGGASCCRSSARCAACAGRARPSWRRSSGARPPRASARTSTGRIRRPQPRNDWSQPEIAEAESPWTLPAAASAAHAGLVDAHDRRPRRPRPSGRTRAARRRGARSP